VRRRYSFLTAILTALILISFLPAFASGELYLSAKSAVLIDAHSGKVLYSYNENERLPMASTTKIMTAITALEECDIDDIVTVSVNAVGIEGSSVYLVKGEKLTLEQLLYALMLESANDAAVAIAIHVSGSIESFAGLMNKKAADLGLENTNFENPHGLYHENHYTTALELARISAYALKNDKFREIVSCTRKVIPLNGDYGSRVLINHNKMLKNYDGAIGVKTGYTKQCGRCLVSAAERDDLTLVAVTLNAHDDWHDHTVMLDYGFDNYRAVKLEVVPNGFLMPVVGGTLSEVYLLADEAESVLVSKKSGELTYEKELPTFCYAPIVNGQKIGKIIFYIDGERIGETTVRAVGEVAEKKTAVDFFKKLLKLFPGFN